MPAVTLAVALALSTPAARTADPETARITGEYDGDGTDIKGQKYKVQVKIEQEGDAYRVTWRTPDGQDFVGAGIRTGKILSVGWAGQQGPRVIVGMTVYEIKKDGTLDGKWTMLGAKGVVRTETLLPSA
ncbi:MAG TPA: hypothetical protein VM597_09600 [Gemmataceae bacterium]|jgi:hypothetical protein|nr:hypothetical protein [Gemmataceae bacterium]